MPTRSSWLRSLLTVLVCAACGQEPGHSELWASAEPSASAGVSAPASGVGGIVAAAGGSARVSKPNPDSLAGSGGASAGARPPLAVSAAGRQGAAGSGVGAAGSGAGAAGNRAAATASAAGRQGAAGAVAAAGSGAVDQRYAPCPTNDACKILPLGDSITFGIGYDGGYRVELFRRALADGKQLVFTGSLSNGPDMVEGKKFPKKNEGHSGWKIDQLLPLIPMPALQEPPHIILLMIGTNDIAQNDELASAPQRVVSLIDKLVMNAPDALIVVAKLIPLGRGMDVPTFNSALAKLVEEQARAGKHVMLVDQFTGFPTSELGDGVHPSQQGYERMAGVWYAAIAGMLH